MLFLLALPLRIAARALWKIGGKPLVLACVRAAHAMHMRKSLVGHPLVVLFGSLLLVTIFYQWLRADDRGSRASPLSPDAIVEQVPAATTPGSDYVPSLVNIPVLPGEEELLPLPTIAGGNALLTPSIATTRLENRLRESPEEYVIQEGDTLSDIAERFGISIETILWENKLTLRSILRPGAALTILPVSGLSHTVTRGETIATIARRYKAEERAILEFNEIAEGATIAIGQKLIIPEGEPAPVVVRRPALSVRPAPRSAVAPPTIAGKLSIPVVYRRISQWFTWRHSGIDMAGTYGTPVTASESGVVVQSGWGTGYGLYVLIDHGDGLMTRYAHNSKNLVARGAQVRRGQTIALLGSTGRSSGPHVHFETIVNGRFVNPVTFLFGNR